MLSEELSYLSRRDPLWKRWTMRAIENVSGRRRLLQIPGPGGWQGWSRRLKDTAFFGVRALWT